MDRLVSPKTRPLVTEQTLASATATPYPTFPDSPDANGKVTFLGDMLGARIAGFRWHGSFSGFTDAYCTIQTSNDGENWITLKAFTQQSASPFDTTIWLLDADPRPLRFVRALIDMTGTPGTSEHNVEAFYDQVGPRGPMADGIPDRDN